MRNIKVESRRFSQSSAVTVGLEGGLGNQLFQYAVGRSICLRNDNCPLLLDVRWLNGQSYRGFDLDRYAHIGHPAHRGLRPLMPPYRPARKVTIAWGKLTGQILAETQNTLDQRILDAGRGVYLRGYWQVPTYFEAFADQIKSELVLKDPATGRNKEMLEFIRQNYCISVHVRRGDFFSNEKNLNMYAQCLSDYYANSAQEILDRDPGKPKFILFSNDFEWARENVTLPGETIFMNHNDEFAGYEDLRLMAACRHNIIANSSLSWWGAWLNPNPDKIVATPRKWFIQPRYSNDFINQAEWIVIDNAQPVI